MTPDPKNEALRWLEQADAEFQDAELLKQSERYYLALFLCQQSAEKALKAFIYLHEEEPIFTHSVANLLRIAANIDEDFTAHRDAKRLDDYYIPTRYPNGLPGEIPSQYYDDPKEVERALALTCNIIGLVRKKLAAT